MLFSQSPVGSLVLTGVQFAPPSSVRQTCERVIARQWLASAKATSTMPEPGLCCAGPQLAPPSVLAAARQTTSPAAFSSELYSMRAPAAS